MSAKKQQSLRDRPGGFIFFAKIHKKMLALARDVCYNIIKKREDKAPQEKEEKTMWKPKTINAYVNGKKVCDVVKEALAHNMMAEEMKRRIKEQYPDVEFKVERK